MADPLIEIHNATVWQGSTRVFTDFSLSIEQREHTAVLGPNGAGKTTLLKLLSRELYLVVAPDAYVRVLGKERWNVWDLRKHIGIVSHDLQMEYLKGTRGRDVVLSGFSASIGIHGVSRTFTSAEREAALRVIERLGVSALADKRLGHMSTGQQRRFLLARALVHEPHTLILDEPTAGLDLSAAFYYLHTIRSLMASGVSVVLVTHHINEIPPEISRIVLLKDGEVVADGNKRDVLTQARLVALYGTPLRLLEADGYFVALPTNDIQEQVRNSD